MCVTTTVGSLINLHSKILVFNVFGIFSSILDAIFFFLKTVSSDNGNFAILVALPRQAPF
jgi:hypothetical protein